MSLYCLSVCIYTCKQLEKTGCNEDSAAIIPCGDDAGVLVIADGVGGISGGDKASAIVINELNKRVINQSDPALLRDSILDGIEKANSNILSMGTGAGWMIW